MTSNGGEVHEQVAGDAGIAQDKATTGSRASRAWGKGGGFLLKVVGTIFRNLEYFFSCKKKKALPKRQNRPWVVATCLAILVGMLISLLVPVIDAFSGGSSDAKGIKTWLFACAIVGFALAGIGQILRSAAHGAQGSGRTVDGVGKVMSTFGWSLGLLTYLASNVKDWPIIVLFFLGILSVAGVLVYYMYEPLRETENEPSESIVDGSCCMKRPGFVGGSRDTDGEWSHGPTLRQGTPLLG